MCISQGRQSWVAVTTITKIVMTYSKKDFYIHVAWQEGYAYHGYFQRKLHLTCASLIIGQENRVSQVLAHSTSAW